jgi:TonB family protein
MSRLPRPWLLSFGVHFVLVLAIIGYFFRSRPHREKGIPIELQLSDVHVHHLDEGRRRILPDRMPPNSPLPIPGSAAGLAEAPVPKVETLQTSDLSGMGAGERNEYLSRLIRLISARKSYPRVSILNEEQGVVQIRVTLGSEGKIVGVEQVASSGFARLDQAAFETLRSFDSLPLPPGYPQGVRLLIPIRFEINPGH